MKIIVDINIPLIDELLGHQFDITKLSSDEITRENLQDADTLICRSVTAVNETLLAGTTVKFVGTTTSGFDHFNTQWLEANNIAWRAAVGCNALAVAEYVVSCVALLRKNNYLHGTSLRAGIIGVGHVGKLVAEKLKILGFELLLNDPPRAEQEQDFKSTPLNEFKDLDLICLHTPLTTAGPYPTYHLINEEFLKQQKAGGIVLNASRGAVVSTDVLLNSAKHLSLCLDVYEHEPHPNLKLIQQTLLSTPHIAGHSIQAKWRGTEMIVQQLMDFLGRTYVPLAQYPIAPPTLDLSHLKNWEDIVLALYNPEQDSELLRNFLQQNATAGFSQLRNIYQIRHEFAYSKIKLPDNNLTIKNKTILFALFS